MVLRDRNFVQLQNIRCITGNIDGNADGNVGQAFVFERNGAGGKVFGVAFERRPSHRAFEGIGRRKRISAGTRQIARWASQAHIKRCIIAEHQRARGPVGGSDCGHQGQGQNQAKHLRTMARERWRRNRVCDRDCPTPNAKSDVMSDLTIQCPKCSNEIELTEQLAGPMLADLRSSFNEELAKREAQAAKAVQVATAQAKEAGKAEAAGAQAALLERVKEQEIKLREAQAAQAAALRREQALADKEAELELTVQKTIAAERAVMAEKLGREAQEKASLKVAEQDQMIEGMKKQIEALKQKSEQGSMQTQGEAAEMVHEDTLSQAFAVDGFSPVPKGQSGADLRQDVMINGRIAGSILWENKQTKNWSGGWLAKLRGDQRASGCEVAVITSVALPDGIDTFGFVDGVWVCAPRYAVPLASSLRQGLIDVAGAKGRAIGQETKAELVYDYLTGTQFKQRIDAIVERFEDMQLELAKERKFMERGWALRAKQIDLVIASTVGMHGDLQGIAGRSMPEIESIDALMIDKDD